MGLIHNTVKFLKNVLGSAVSLLTISVVLEQNYLIIAAAELAYTHMFRIFG